MFFHFLHFPFLFSFRLFSMCMFCMDLCVYADSYRPMRRSLSNQIIVYKRSIYVYSMRLCIFIENEYEQSKKNETIKIYRNWLGGVKQHVVNACVYVYLFSIRLHTISYCFAYTIGQEKWLRISQFVYVIIKLPVE